MDHRIRKARDHFGIVNPEDWQEIRPEWVRMVPNVGPRTLDLIRLFLAGRGLTLKDDACPAFWQKNLQTASIGGQVSLVDNAVTEAFTILIDSQEKHPWTFQGFKSGGLPVIQPIQWKSLGPTHGDYSVAGLESFVHIERKSIEDALSTFLSHGERGDRWTATLEFLAEIPAGHIVVEGTRMDCINAIQPHGKRSKGALVNEFINKTIAWHRKYGLTVQFLDDRRLAEDWSRRIMRDVWRHESGSRQYKPAPKTHESIDAAISALNL